MKRITQETFDEVVQENINEFDMTFAEAISDASNQFIKQGIDLSNIDLSGGIEKSDFLDQVSLFKSYVNKSSENDDLNEETHILDSIEKLRHYLDENYQYSKRNLSLYLSDGLHVLHGLINESQSQKKYLLSVIDFYKYLSKLSVDVRDFFEPTGSKHLCGLLTKELSQFHPLESNSNIQVIISCISLARTVSKSEDIKVSLMRHGLGNIIVSILSSYKDSDLDVYSNSVFTLYREVCLAMKGLCIHDDIRREMSCAYDNGRFFNNSPIVAPILMKFSSKYVINELLASSALSAARSLITTEEAVKIMTQHGAMNIPKSVLGHSCRALNTTGYINTISSVVSDDSSLGLTHNIKDDLTVELIRSTLGLMRNLCADDKRKDKLVSDGSLELMIQTMTIDKYANDALLVEHGLACLAAMSLRSPFNSTKIVRLGTMELVVKLMRKFNDKLALLRQACLLIRNIAGRCFDLRSILLDSGVENVLRDAGKYQDCVDEAYGALRDLECEVQRVRITEDGKVEAAYENFGNIDNFSNSEQDKPKRFNPVFEETYDILMRVQNEAKAPFSQDNENIKISVDQSCHDHDHSH